MGDGGIKPCVNQTWIGDMSVGRRQTDQQYDSVKAALIVPVKRNSIMAALKHHDGTQRTTNSNKISDGDMQKTN